MNQPSINSIMGCDTVDGSEIRLTTWIFFQTLANNGIFSQPQLVSLPDFWLPSTGAGCCCRGPRVVFVPQDGTIGRSCVVRFVVSISDEYLGF